MNILLKKHGESKVVLILDGFDELKIDENEGTIMKLLGSDYMRSVRVLVTSRPSHMANLPKQSHIPYAIYVKKYFMHSGQKAQKYMSRITQNPVLSHFASNPLTLSMICFLLRGQSIDEQKYIDLGEINSLSSLVKRFLCAMFSNYVIQFKKCLTSIQIRDRTSRRLN